MSRAADRLVISTAFLCVAAFAQAPAVIKEFRSPAVIDLARMIKPAEMSEERVAALALEHLRGETSSYRLLRLTIGVEQVDILRTLGTGIPSGNGYNSYLDVLERLGPVRLPVAQVYATPKGAILLYSEPGRITERILFGTDPTLFVVSKTHYRLVGAFVKEIPLEARTASTPYTLHLFFVLHGTPTQTATRHISRRMYQVFGAEYGLTVHLRRDPWYLGWAGFANPYRFSKTGEIPTPEAYKSSTQGICSNHRFGEPRASSVMQCSVGPPP
jgi:hypothetical protein